MTVYVYKVISAPNQGKRGKGVKGIDARFANSLETAINDLAVDGWEYIRAESLPSIDRQGVLRKRVETFQNLLVFRKNAADVASEEEELSNRPSFFKMKKKKAAAEVAKKEPVIDTVEDVAEDVAEDLVEDTVEDAVDDAVKEALKDS